jgi:hypothetical protein
MGIRYTKWLQNIRNDHKLYQLQFQVLPKYTQIGIFGIKIYIPSGSPDLPSLRLAGIRSRQCDNADFASSKKWKFFQNFFVTKWEFFQHFSSKNSNSLRHRSLWAKIITLNKSYDHVLRRQRCKNVQSRVARFSKSKLFSIL